MVALAIVAIGCLAYSIVGWRAYLRGHRRSERYPIEHIMAIGGPR